MRNILPVGLTLLFASAVLVNGVAASDRIGSNSSKGGSAPKTIYTPSYSGSKSGTPFINVTKQGTITPITFGNKIVSGGNGTGNTIHVGNHTLSYKPTAQFAKNYCGNWGAWCVYNGGYQGHCGWWGGWCGGWYPGYYGGCYSWYRPCYCWFSCCDMVIVAPVVVQPVPDAGPDAGKGPGPDASKGPGPDMGKGPGGHVHDDKGPDAGKGPDTSKGPDAGKGPAKEEAKAQFRRFLKVKNESGAKLTVFVQYQVRTEDGDALWLPGEPGSDKTVQLVLDDGQELVVENKGKKVASDTIRIWAESEKVKFLDYRGKDVVLVPEKDKEGVSVYFAAEMATFTFVFPKLEQSSKVLAADAVEVATIREQVLTPM